MTTPNPMADLHWIFRDRDGCAFGSMLGLVAGNSDQALREFYDTARERKAAQAKGVTVELVHRKDWSAVVEPCMKRQCGHAAVTA